MKRGDIIEKVEASIVKWVIDQGNKNNLKISINGFKIPGLSEDIQYFADQEKAALKDHHENLQYKVQIEHHAELDTLKALVEKAFLAGRSKTSWEQFKKENAETLK